MKFLTSLGLITGLCLPFFAGAETRAPEDLFKKYCFDCHGTGWEDAPVVGDSFAWEERREQGIETLLKHTIEGYYSMPPKGGCNDCSNEEFKALIEWMME